MCCNAIPNRYVYVGVGLDEIVFTHFMHSIIVVVVVVQQQYVRIGTTAIRVPLPFLIFFASGVIARMHRCISNFPFDLINHLKPSGKYLFHLL